MELQSCQSSVASDHRQSVFPYCLVPRFSTEVQLEKSGNLFKILKITTSWSIILRICYNFFRNLSKNYI